MIYSIEQIATALKAARDDKQLTQRELSRKVRLPQSQISKIENGTVDLRLSSLVELSRVLDLELMLVPRKLVPAVQSMIRSSKTTDREAAQRTYFDSLEQVRKAANELRKLQKPLDDLKRYSLDPNALRKISAIDEDLRRLPNAVAHGMSLPSEKIRTSAPAYRLDEDEADG